MMTVAGRFLAISLKRDKEASEALLTGVAVIPNSAMLQLDYGEDLQRQGRNYEAIGPLRKAFEAQPDNIRFQIALAETELALGHAGEASKLVAIVKGRLGTGEKFPGNLRARAETLVARAAPAEPAAK